ncbi:MAG TPA: GTPase ObgE [bacterium]|nr:GTPase ObgE [bacterium]
MDFIDEVTLWVSAGRGGDGCIAFRREKFVPKGGPCGGDGGDGGSVVFRAENNLSTLLDLRHRKKVRAENGKQGKGGNMTGKKGESVVVAVPRGTLVYDEEGRILADLTESGQQWVAAEGGKGGKGNTRFATSTRQTPDFSEPGTPGEKRKLRLELKLLADAGLVGHPNAGKSTLLARLSSARPKIADYPFTTLVPNLGIVDLGGYQSMVLADIPGLIEGAHQGKGLGDRFLRHIERTRVLLLMVDAHSMEPGTAVEKLIGELKLFNPEIIRKSKLAILNKIDLLTDEERQALPNRIEGITAVALSAVTGEGIQHLIQKLAEVMGGGRET